MKTKKIVALCFLFAYFQNVTAQVNIELDNIIESKGRIQYATFKNFIPNKQEEKLNILNQITSNNPSLSFRKTITHNLGKNIFQDKFQIYKNGIKLRGGEYLITYSKDHLVFVHGFFANFQDEIKYSKKDKLLSIENALKYFNEEISNKQNLINSPIIYYYNYQSEVFQLAYEVYLEAKNSFRAENIYISVFDGSLLGSENKICKINFPGSAQTQYNGVQNIIADAPNANGPFRLFETRGPNNVIIHTLNNNFGGIEITGATDLFDNDNNWTFAEHGNLRAGFDAHWGAETVFDYWRIVHNRNSINNAGMTIESYINVDMQTLTGTPINAAWFNNRMYYGNGIMGGNVTCLDVCAHEFGHGIDEYTGNLAYEKESGALDEGFADIWGACVEAWATPLKQRWLMGEDLNVGAFRSLANPNAFGQPDTYLGTNWVNTTSCTPNNGNDFCGVHTNSGVLNHWFFLLSEGGSGINDIGNTFNVNGLNINTAAQIAYRTKLLMNNSLANYALCRQMSIQAAIQLFGNCSNEVVQVTNAWYAVGVGAAWVNQTYSFYNPTYGLDCNSVTITANFPTNSNVTWTTTNGLLINGNNSPFTIQSNQVEISSPNGNSGTISASIGGLCNISAISFCPCEPWDNPTITWVWSAPMTGEPLQAYVSPDYPNAIKYEWYINGQLVETTSTSFLSTYNWPCTSEGEGLTVIAINSCGASAPVNGGTYSPICYQYRSSSNVNLYPNPASTDIIVKLEEVNAKSINSQKHEIEVTLKSIAQIRIIDKLGITRKVLKFPKGNLLSTFSVAHLPSDIYYLDISDGNAQIRKPLIIRR